MSRVMLVYEAEMPTVSIMRECYKALFGHSQIRCDFKQNINIMPEDIENTDTIILIRPYNYLSMKIAEKARRCGVYIIFFADDDLFHLPPGKNVMPWRSKALWRSLKYSDMILSSNQYIVHKYKNYTVEKRGVVIHTVVTDEEIGQIPEHEKNTSKIRIVYAAGSDHAVLFEEYIKPILSRLDKEYGKNISLTLVGVQPDIDVKKYSMEIIFKESMPLLEYREYMRKERFDIGLAPLHNNSFCKCKYFNKYIEYTLVGVVGIYSNCEPYTFVIEDGVNGILAKDSDWYECIKQLMDDELRDECLKNSVDQIITNFHPKVIREKYVSDIPELLKERNISRCGSLVWSKIIYKCCRIMDDLYLLLFYLKDSGMIEVLKKIKGRYIHKRSC